jgi:hypothetical protein
MVERVEFTLGKGCRMDEFYLSEEALEWIGLKKSQYLSVLIQEAKGSDFQFHEYMEFDELIPQTLSLPDWTFESSEDGYRLKNFVRLFTDRGIFQQVVLGALIPDEKEQDVFIPILTFVTRHEELIQHFSVGAQVHRPKFN